MALPYADYPPRYHIVMFSFDGVDTAAQVLDKLKHEGALEETEVEGDATISRQPSGKVQLHERGGATVGATFGAAAAGVLGLVAGPVILPIMLVAGAVLGGVAGHFAGQLLPAEDLKRVAEDLRPNSSAYIAVVDAVHAQPLSEAFSAEGAKVLNIPIETELASAIREGITHSVTRL
jgi:uncharacterized membrane protein